MSICQINKFKTCYCFVFPKWIQISFNNWKSHLLYVITNWCHVSQCPNVKFNYHKVYLCTSLCFPNVLALPVANSQTSHLNWVLRCSRTCFFNSAAFFPEKSHLSQRWRTPPCILPCFKKTPFQTVQKYLYYQFVILKELGLYLTVHWL